MQGGICDDSGSVSYSLFLLGNNYCHPNNSILKDRVMDRTDKCIHFISLDQKTIGMSMGK